MTSNDSNPWKFLALALLRERIPVRVVGAPGRRSRRLSDRRIAKLYEREWQNKRQGRTRQQFDKWFLEKYRRDPALAKVTHPKSLDRIVQRGKASLATFEPRAIERLRGFAWAPPSLLVKRRLVTRHQAELLRRAAKLSLALR